MGRTECRAGRAAREPPARRRCGLVHPALEGEGTRRLLGTAAGPGWGAAASPKLLKRCHPHPAGPRPTCPQPNLAVARVGPPYRVTEIGQARLRSGEVLAVA